MRTLAQLTPALAIALLVSACPGPTAIDPGLLTGDPATGGVRGFVYRDAKQTPLAGATVTADGQTTTAASLAGPQVPAEEQFSAAYATATIVVPHDFGDGAGAVESERRLRKNPLLGSDAGRYVYLRRGEYFLEQLPPGTATVAVGVCGGTASETVAVSGGHVTPAAALTVDDPAPIPNPDGSAAAIYAAALQAPAQGLVAQVTNQQVHYSADDAQVQLKAWPGASAAVVNLLSVTYVYTDPYGEEAALDAVAHPIAPVTIPAASSGCYGAPATIAVPLAYSSLSNLLVGPHPPKQVIARIQFVTSAGDTLQDASQSDLTLNVPIDRQ